MSFPLTFYATIVVGLFIAYKIFTRKTKFDTSIAYKKENESHYGTYKNDGKNNNKYCTTQPNEEIDIQFSQNGVGSQTQSPPMTVWEVFDKTVANNANDPLLAKEYQTKESTNDVLIWKWKYWTRKEAYDEVFAAARGFIALGLKQWESVCIMGFNAPQWFMADLAAIYSGGIACGVYTTNNEGQCKYIMNDCKGRILVVENRKILNKCLKIAKDLKYLSAIIVYDDDSAVKEYKGELNLITWTELIQKYGSGSDNSEIFRRQSLIKPGHCCTLIYTSGTTGPPKGVMLSHDNMTWSIKSILASQKGIKFWGKNAVKHALVSYLPLSHVAAQMLDIHGPLAIGANGGLGTIYFARTDALKGSLNITLKFVQPTVFLGVPRVWEKIEEKMRLIGKKGNFVVKRVSKLAKQLGLHAAYNKQLGGNRNIPFGYAIVDKLIFSTIKSKLGFQRLQLALTGAAPIKKSTTEYFHSVGIDLLEAYGMSESSALMTIGRGFHNKIGSVGPSLPGVKVLISAEKEILCRGRNVMMGYIYDQEKTANAIDENGYLHTGDIGMLDSSNNLLYITGRIKELIITAGGENIAPVPIEDYIKTIRSAISNFVLIGEQKKYLTALVTLKCEQISEKEYNTNLYGDALEMDKSCKTVNDARQSEVWKQYIQSGIDDYNSNKDQCVSRAQRIQYWNILTHDFSIGSDELTSTLKLKRSVIMEKHRKEIESMY